MKQIRQNDIIIGVLCVSSSEVLFGLSYMFNKTAMDTAEPFALLGWRFLLAILVMFLCIKLGLIKMDLKGKPIKPLLIIAFFSPCLYFIGETIGINHTTASESGVFLACIPVAALLASTLILKKKPTKMQVTGILITLSGVMITIFAVGLVSSLSIIGYSFLFIAIIAYALYVVFVEKAAAYSVIDITYVMLLFGAIVFGILAVNEAIINGNINELILLPFKERNFTIAIIFQGIGCSVIAFFLFNVAISKIGVNRASSFIGVSTVVSIISGTISLNENFTIYQIIGAFVILSGVYIANTNKADDKKDTD